MKGVTPFDVPNRLFDHELELNVLLCAVCPVVTMKNDPIFEAMCPLTDEARGLPSFSKKTDRLAVYYKHIDPFALRMET